MRSAIHTLQISIFCYVALVKIKYYQTVRTTLDSSQIIPRFIALTNKYLSG